jgi:hypothetical protein
MILSVAVTVQILSHQVFRADKRTNKIRNSNIEIRNKPRGSNPNYEIRNRLVLNFAYFGQLKLFRISDFVLRIFCSWRPLRLCASHLFPIGFSIG